MAIHHWLCFHDIHDGRNRHSLLDWTIWLFVWLRYICSLPDGSGDHHVIGVLVVDVLLLSLYALSAHPDSHVPLLSEVAYSQGSHLQNLRRGLILEALLDFVAYMRAVPR